MTLLIPASQSMSNLKLEMITATTDGEMRRASDVATKLRAAEWENKNQQSYNLLKPRR